MTAILAMNLCKIFPMLLARPVFMLEIFFVKNGSRELWCFPVLFIFLDYLLILVWSSEWRHFYCLPIVYQLKIRQTKECTHNILQFSLKTFSYRILWICNEMKLIFWNNVFKTLGIDRVVASVITYATKYISKSHLGLFSSHICFILSSSSCRVCKDRRMVFNWVKGGFQDVSVFIHMFHK